MNRIQALLSSAVFVATVCQSRAVEPEFPPKDPWYARSIESKDYLAATAHETDYPNKELWPDEMRQAAFVRQAWPSARVLVWANPGAGVKDGWEAKYWLENGKPATEPFDEDTDLVFPDHPGGM